MEIECEEYSTVGKGHGRVERRQLISTTLFNNDLNWPGVKQVCKIIRRRTRRGKTTTEIVYAITSVGRDRANAKTLLKWNRGHWGIENRLHWIRDETFGEDRCRVRKESAPQLLAAIRNLSINWLRSRGINTIAKTLRHHGWNPHRLFTKRGKQNF
jgi:predicted transposase YbfD/YdcC